MFKGRIHSDTIEMSQLIERYQILVTPAFLNTLTREQLIQEMKGTETTPATVYGSGNSDSINDRIRKASRLKLADATSAFVQHKLIDYQETIERHFSITLNDCEEPQFLRYDVGDFFVAHQDGNTGLIKLTSDAERRVSVVLFVNQQSEGLDSGTYSGGSLKFSNYRERPEYREFFLPADAGTLVAFRSELTHEVLPVTRGRRYSIVSWYR